MNNIIIIILIIVCTFDHCYAGNTFDLQDPFEIKKILGYGDGGTIGVILEDPNGKEFSFCFTPRGNLFYGATHANLKEAKPVEAESDLEKDILSVIQNAIDLKYDNKKQINSGETVKANKLTTNELNIPSLLRALNFYKENQKVKLFKKGKTELIYVNAKIGYSFEYPVLWEGIHGRDGIQLLSDGEGMAFVLASISVRVENAKGISPEKWHQDNLNKYNHGSWRYEKELLNYKVAGEEAYRFWNIVPGQDVKAVSKFKMGEIVFVKDDKIYSFLYLNQYETVEKFEAVLQKVLSSFQITNISGQ